MTNEAIILTDRKEIAKALNFGKYPVLSYNLDKGEGSKARVSSRNGDFYYRCELFRNSKQDFSLLTKASVLSSSFNVYDCIEMAEYANAPIIKPNQEVAILIHSKVNNLYQVVIAKSGRIDGMSVTATTFKLEY